MAFNFGDIFLNWNNNVAPDALIQHFDPAGTHIADLPLTATELPTATSIQIGGVTVGLNGHLYCLLDIDDNECYVGEFDADGVWVGLLGDNLADTFPPAMGGTTFVSLSPLFTALNGDLIGMVARGFIGANYFRMATDGSMVSTSAVLSGEIDTAHCYLPGSDDDVYGLDSDWNGVLLTQDTSALTETTVTTLSEALGDWDNLFDAAYSRFVLWKINGSGPYVVDVDVYDRSFAHVDTHSGGSFDDATYDVFWGRVSPCGDAVWFIARDNTTSPATAHLYRIDLSTGAVTSVTAPTPSSTDHLVVRLTICKDPRGQSTAAITDVGPTLWVEADSVTGVASGDEMAYWPESGPIAIDGADDLTSALFNPPLWIEDGVCGKPLVRFRGSGPDGLLTPDDGRRGQNLDGSIPPNLELHPAGEFTVLVVGRLADFGSSSPPTEVVFSAWASNNAFLEFWRKSDGSGVVHAHFITDSSGNEVELEVPYTEGDWVYIEMWGEGGYASGSYPRPDQPGTLHLRVNGGTEVTAPWAGFRFAENEGGGWSSAPNGDEIAEILGQFIFPRALTESERDAFFEGYLPCKYPCIFSGGEGGGAGLFSWVFACC
jgi:hypothetical protein